MSVSVARPYGGKGGHPKTFTLPVSGSVLLEGPEVEIVRTREFQRLGGLKQLGTSYVVFRGAVHTRFEHSIGALHEAERMVTAINANPYREQEVDEVGHRLARLGALLHDLPHVPFGHTLEDELGILQRHDVNKYREQTLLQNSEIGEILRRTLDEEEYHLLLQILAAKKEEDFKALGEKAYVADIVGNTLCADLLDYVQRDLRACGMPVALGDRFLDYLTVTSPAEGGGQDHWRTALNITKRGMPRPDIESEIIKLLSYRYELAERVYFHHAKNAASVMIGRAVLEAGFASSAEGTEAEDANFHWLSDDMLLWALAKPNVAEAFGLKRNDHGGSIELAATLATGVIDHCLYKIAYLAVDDDLAYNSKTIFEKYSKPAARLELENRLASQAGLEPGQVLVHIPRPKMMTKEADIRVRTDHGEIVPLGEWDRRHSRRVNALNEAHRRLWRLAVYVDPAVYQSCGAVVRAAAETEFGAPARYVEPRRYSALQSVLFDEVAKAEGIVAVDKEAVLEGVQPYSTARSRAEIESEIRDKIHLIQAEETSESETDHTEEPGS